MRKRLTGEVIEQEIKKMNEVKVNLDDYCHNKARNLVEQMARDGIIAKGKDAITPIFLMLKESFCPIQTQKEGRDIR